jgi:hypothetical protein
MTPNQDNPIMLLDLINQPTSSTSEKTKRKASQDLETILIQPEPVIQKLRPKSLFINKSRN